MKSKCLSSFISKKHNLVMQKEFSFKTSNHTFGSFIGMLLIALTIGLLVGNLAFSNHLRNSLLAASGIILFIMQFTTILMTKRMTIRINDDGTLSFTIKNWFKVTELKNKEVIKIQSRDIALGKLGSMKFYFNDSQTFYFSLMVISSTTIKHNQNIELINFLKTLINNFDFEKKEHHTKLGKSKFMYEYWNPKYIKNYIFTE